MTTLLAIPSNGIAGTNDSQNYTEYTYMYTATGAITSLSFEFRQDPGFWNLDDVSFSNSSGTNLFLNGGFETGNLTDWTPISTQGVGASGGVTSGTPTTAYDGSHSGSYYWDDGTVGGVDGIDQNVQTVAGQAYTISFYLANDGAGDGELALVQATTLRAPSTPVLVSDYQTTGTDQTSNTTPTISGTADIGQVIEVYDNGTQIGTSLSDSAGNWSYAASTPLAVGSHAITATEGTNGVLTGSSAALDLTIQPAAPSAAALAGTSNSGNTNDNVTNNTDPVFTGTGTSGDTITLFDGTTAIGTSSVASDGTWSVAPTTPLADGTHSITTTQTTAGGQTSTASQPVSIVVDTTPPSINGGLAHDTGASSTDGITNNDALAGTTEAGDIVTFAYGNTTLGSTTADENGNWEFTPNLGDGVYTVDATASDPAGNTSTDPITFELDTSIPASTSTPALAAGSDSGAVGDNITNQSTLTVVGAAVAGDTVTLLDNNVAVGITTAAQDGTWSITPSTPFADGVHSLNASQTNTAGTSSAASPTFPVRVDTSTPAPSSAPTLAAASDSGTQGDEITNHSTPTIVGIGDAGDTVALSDDGDIIGTTVVGQDGTWSVALSTPLQDGTHTLNTTESNVAGTVSAPSSTTTVDIITTIPIVTAALADDSGLSSTDGVTSDPTITGRAEADSTVTILNGSTVLGTAGTSESGYWYYTPTGLADGAYTLTVSQTDVAGNTGSTSVSMTLDRTAPTVSLALNQDTGYSATDGITQDSAMTGTATGAGTIAVTLNGQTIETYSSAGGQQTISPLGLTDGNYQVTLTDTDTAGNVGGSTLDFTLDRVAPTVTATLANDTGASSTDYITSNDILSGTGEANSTVVISNGGTVLGSAVASTSGAWTYAPTGLSDGSHTLAVSETDAAGNTGTTNITFVQDTTAPTVTVALSNDTGTSSTDVLTADAVLKGTAEAGSTVTILNGTTVLGSTAVAADGTWSYAPTGLRDGTYTLTASETDIAGNTGTASVELILDTTAPSLTLALQDDTGASSTDGITSDRTIVGTADGPGNIVVSLNGQVIDSYQSPGGEQIFTPAGLPDGTYQAVISDTDAAGNVATVSLNVTLDTTAPVVTATLVLDSGAPGNNGITNNDALAGTAEASSTVTIVNGDTTLGTTTADANGNWTFTPTGLTDGDYSLTASETDTAGNMGTATVGFTLETAVPTVTAALANDTGASAHDGITDDASLTGTAAAGSVVTISEGTSVLGTATADANGNWGFVPSGLVDGNHTLTVSQTDAAGNTGTANVGITLIATAPYLTAGLLQDTGVSATDGITNIDTLAGTAEAGGTVTILNGTDVLGTTTAAADGTWNFTPTGLTDGAYTLTASQTDAAGNTGTAPVNFTVDTATPVLGLTLANDTSGGQNMTQDASLIVTTNDPGTISVSIGNQVLETYATTGGAQAITPQGLADGTYQISVAETDTAGNASIASLKITLDTAAPVVTAGLADDTGPSATDGITNADTLTGTADADSTVTILNGTTVVGTATSGADGSWSYTPTSLADGTYNLTATQTDAAGNTGSSPVVFTLDTTLPVVAASLANDTGISATDGITSDGTLAGIADPNSTVTILNGTTVLGSAIAGGDGSWIFTPTGLADGAYNLTATQTDAAGNNSSASVSMTLEATVPTVTASLTNDTGTSSSDGITNDDTLAGTAEAGGTVTILDGLTVVGTTTAGTDGSWIFKPTGLSDGAHVLTATQTDMAGNTGSTTVALTLETTTPTVTAALADDTGLSPSDGITNVSTLVGTAEAGSLVNILNGNAVLGSTTAAADGTWTYTPTGLADGAYNLTVSQTDAAGNTGSTLVSLTLKAAVPTVTAFLSSDTGPSATDGITSNDALAGTAEAGSTVTVLDGNAVLGTTVVGSDGTWTFAPTGLGDGSTTLTASETDAAGNTGSASVNVTLITTVPVVTAMLAADADGSLTTDGALTGTAEAGSTVSILDGSTVVGTTIAGSDGIWNYTTTSLGDGDYTLTALQADAAGNSGSASVSFSLDRVYTANVNNIDDASNVFMVLDKPGLTANIDLTNNSQPVTVFGGGANLNLTAANAVVVMNGPGQTSGTTVTSLGNDFVWAGQSTIDLNGASGNRVVLSGNGPTSGTLNLDTSGTASNEVDVWGTAGTTQTVNNLGGSQAVIFGGTSDLDFTGGNSVIVLNGPNQSGLATVDSTGGNTVWAGTSTLSFTEGTSGDDALVLTGGSGTTVHGASGTATGTTTVIDAGGTGQFEYDGGSKAANITIGAEQATIYGGSGNQTLALDGNGSLVVADSDTVSGLQTVTVAQGATGSMFFWGGSNNADITLGAGGAFIQAGTGNTTLRGGSGGLTLDLSKSESTVLNVDGNMSGSIDITGYTGSNATLNLTNVDSQNIIGGNLVMHMHDGSSITFQSYVPTYTHTLTT